MIDENQFVNQIQANQKIIYKVVGLYTDTKEDKEDLYQETLLQLWKSIEKYEGKASFSTWMYRVALNVALNFRRRSKHHFIEPIDKVENLKSEISNKEDYEILYLLIKQLPEGDKMIISLHLDGYGNDEIAEIVGISRNNTNVKIHRIKENISKLYDQLTDGHQ
jgi:RNA polymerase sigma-70 factor (ECF subfamily)